MNKEILSAMEKLDCDYCLSGYRYIISAVTEALKSPYRTPIMSLYSDVGSAYHKSYLQVERCVRYFIEATWKNGNRDFIKSITHSNTRPTNSKFIYALVEYVRRQLARRHKHRWY